MAAIFEIQQSIIDEFQSFSDWTERYKHIIKQGRNLGPLDDKYKVEENLVRGCQSQVWLHTKLEDGKIIFEADSDAAITKGLVALMVRLYSGQEPETIIATPPEFIKKIGMQQHLSPTRSNGLA
ncbi:MAG TPA: SufE family protein, partial [Balneolaceae bacterium]|nr:SufE family protein [Balneolaceae bacterium]